MDIGESISFLTWDSILSSLKKPTTDLVVDLVDNHTWALVGWSICGPVSNSLNVRSWKWK